MDLKLCGNIKQQLMEALQTKEVLNKMIHVLKEETQNVARLRTRTNDHVSSCQSLAADLESKINMAMELHRVEIQRAHIIEKSIDKLEAVHHQVRSVLRDDAVIMGNEISKMSILGNPSIQSGFDKLEKIFGIHESDKINLLNLNMNYEDGDAMYSDKNYIKQGRNLLRNQRSPNFFIQLTKEDFSAEVLFADPIPRRRSDINAPKSHVKVTSLGTTNTLTVPKTECVTPRVGTGISPSTSRDLRPANKFIKCELNFKENISPKTPIRSPVCSSNHKWKKKDFMLGLSCIVCSDLIYYPRKLVQCTKCMKHAHAICKEMAPSCLPDREKTKSAKPRTPKSASKSYCIGKLKDLVSQTSPKVPALIVTLVSEIEARGIHEINLYNEYVPEKEIISLIKEKLKVKGQIKIFDVNVHVLCGCLKEFIKRLDEPLVSRNTLKELSEIINEKNEKLKCDKLIKSIEGLEQANKDTLVFIILHLQRIVCKTKNTKTDMSKLFGPYILGCAKDDTENIPVETKSIIKIMAELLSLPTVGLAKVLTTMNPINQPDVSAKPTFRYFNTPKSGHSEQTVNKT